MDAVQINASEFVDTSRPVLEAATSIAAEVAKCLRGGGAVVLSVEGVRGVSSSFFNVVISAAADALHNDFSENRFSVVTDTVTQRLVFERSWKAVAKRAT